MIDRRHFLATASPLLAAIALELGSAPRAWAAGEAPLDISPTLEQIRRRLGAPAVGAIAVSTDRVIAQGVAGFRRMGEPGLVSLDAHWQLGSVTKNFTGTLVGMLVERGKLSWDTKIAQIYPEHLRVMAPNVADITIRQLVTHRSGMLHKDPYGWTGDPQINGPGLTLSQRRQRSVPAMLNQPLLFLPGTRFSYANLGYDTLGAIIEKIDGRPYEDMVAQEIARPLGIGLKFGEPALDDPYREPWPHVENGAGWKPVEPVPRHWYGYYVANPVGGISLTLDGFGRWMQAHLRGEQAGGIVSPATFKTLHTPIEQGGVPPFGAGTDRLLGRTLSMGGTNGRNAADNLILLDRGIGLFSAINARPPPQPQLFFFTNTLHAFAEPRNWPAPSLSPPQPNAAGEIEGETLELTHLGGGTVQFQKIPRLSGEWQLWWTGAKDGEKLVLRFAVPVKGHYAIEGTFARNRDYGDATIALGNVSNRLSFHSDKLVWEAMPLGNFFLEAGAHELVVTAQGNAGENGILCHLGLDVLKVRQVG